MTEGPQKQRGGIRLHKFIANSSELSRRTAERWIAAGRVTLNGEVVDRLGIVIEEGDEVCIDGRPIRALPRVTIALHKPCGVLTTTRDPQGRPSVLDLLPSELRTQGVVPVGRLDFDTSGLLVLTNDGELGHRITHPSFETEKEYAAVVRGAPSADALARLERGVDIGDERPTSRARVARVTPGTHSTRVEIVIHEGRKRQLRRMFDAIGHPVLELSRTRIGSLRLGDLAEGAWRELGPGDLRDWAAH